MSYYHEARAQVKAIKERTEANKRRAERRAEIQGVEAEEPVNLLRVDGRACKLFKNHEQRRAVEAGEGMVPWNGRDDNMIDRFDGRALLDFYREHDTRTRRPKSDEDQELEQLLAFEAFRDLVKLAGQSEAAGLAAAEAENLELRASARSAAAENAGLNKVRQQLPQTSTLTPAGFGAYGAVGFSYGDPAAILPPPARPDVSDDSEYESDSEYSDEEDEQPKTMQQEELAAFADSFGIGNFDVMLRRAERHEKEEAEGKVPKPKRAFSRKKAAQRAKRMAGQGRGLQGPSWESRDMKPKASMPAATNAYRSTRRGSPSYEDYPTGRHRRRSTSRSQSPEPSGPRTTYITSFSREAAAPSGGLGSVGGGAQQPDNNTNGNAAPPWLDPSKRAGDIREALPDREAAVPDTGPMLLPAAGTVMRGISAGDYWEKQRQAERQSRYEERQRAREKEKQRERQSQASAPAKPVGKVKETPQERLKRLMAAQINKQFAKDTRTAKQRQAQEEQDAAARRELERSAYTLGRCSPSPTRYRRRSRSPSYSPGRDSSYSPRRDSHSRRSRSPSYHHQRRGSSPRSDRRRR